MARVNGLTRRGWTIARVLLAGTVWIGGCHRGSRIEPVSIANSRLGPMTIAVAPALNLSGSMDFDPDRFADLMASELSYADGIAVIPVSRVLGVLAVQGLDRVESPGHAWELAKLLGADAILVFAVTEYDPYDPPSIGISAQLYGARPRAGSGALDPVALSRQAGLASARQPGRPDRLLAQVHRVFDASHDSVVADVRRFARRRRADESPYGWRQYVVSQRYYIRYCCHAMIRTLLTGENDPVLAENGALKVRMP